MAVSRSAQGTQPAPPPMLERYRADIDQALRSALSQGEPGLMTMLRFHMGWVDRTGAPSEHSAGKCLRPTLCIFTCLALGGTASQAMPAAIALELIHNFSLIHDDVQDLDLERHHRPTVWAVWGKPRAIAAGNAMRILAGQTVFDLLRQAVPPEKVSAVLAVLVERYLEMIEGQYLDMSFEERYDVRVSEYVDMVQRKTGALMEAAFHLGALLGAESREKVEALRQCGRLLGLTFQARDDILGIWGDPALTGKAVGADIRRKKKSLPVVHAFQHASESQRAWLDSLYRRPGELDGDAVEDVLVLMDDLGAREYTQDLAEEKRRQAMAHARSAALPPAAHAELDALADFFLNRLY